MGLVDFLPLNRVVPQRDVVAEVPASVSLREDVDSFADHRASQIAVHHEGVAALEVPLLDDLHFGMGG